MKPEIGPWVEDPGGRIHYRLHNSKPDEPVLWVWVIGRGVRYRAGYQPIDCGHDRQDARKFGVHPEPDTHDGCWLTLEEAKSALDGLFESSWPTGDDTLCQACQRRTHFERVCQAAEKAIESGVVSDTPEIRKSLEFLRLLF